MTIRLAQETDADAISRLSGELGYPTNDEEAAQRLRSALARPDESILVVEEDGAVVGWIHVLGTHRIESGSCGDHRPR
jgi:predicted N-acetyltransferase YhbS